MGSIQNKRGSARGAPPSVYAPFASIGGSKETTEQRDAIKKFFLSVFLLVLLAFIIGFIAMAAGYQSTTRMLK